MNQTIIKRQNLEQTDIDIGGRDIIIGFNEPKIKKSEEDITVPDLDSKLNARLPVYFLPAVDVAKKQASRPRLYVVSAIALALKWNTDNEEEQKIVMMNNNIKIDYLRHFFETFYPEVFSIVEYIVMQDPLKIDEEKLLEIWEKIEQKYPKEAAEIKEVLTRYQYPDRYHHQVSDSENNKLLDGLKYAIAHIFAAGDINFEGNYIHNPIGYATIGGEREKLFNQVRNYAMEVLAVNAESFFHKKVIVPDNIQIIIESQHNVPPPYTGYHSGKNGSRELDEVTYENGRDIDYYEEHKKLSDDIEYLYKHIDKEKYKEFWDGYKSRYLDLKQRYIEAYRIHSNI